MSSQKASEAIVIDLTGDSSEDDSSISESKVTEQQKGNLHRMEPLFFGVPTEGCVQLSCRSCGALYYAASFMVWCGACLREGLSCIKYSTV